MTKRKIPIITSMKKLIKELDKGEVYEAKPTLFKDMATGEIKFKTKIK